MQVKQSGIWLQAPNTACAGTGFVMYYLTGFFGAARFGADATNEGNILENNLGQGNKQGALNIFFAGTVSPWSVLMPAEFRSCESLSTRDSSTDA